MTLNPIKVCVIGTHGLGKTTLVMDVVRRLAGQNALKDLPGLLYVRELAKDIISALDFDWRKCSREETMRFQGLLFNYHVLASMQPAPLISARSPLDTCAYAEYKIGVVIPQLIKDLKEAMDRYDYIYHYLGDTTMTDEQAYIETRLLLDCEQLQLETTTFQRKDHDAIVEEIGGLFLQ